MAIKLLPDGSKKRQRLLQQALKDLGVPLVKPKPIWVEAYDHVLEPLGPLLAADGETCPAGAICFNLTVIPSGQHLREDKKFRPTGQMMINGVPEVEEIPNLMTTEEGWATVETTPSKIMPGPERTDEDPNVRGEVQEPRVTVAELAAARKEAAEMRERAKGEYRAPGGLEHRRKSAAWVDTSWMDGVSRVVRSQPTPYAPDWVGPVEVPEEPELRKRKEPRRRLTTQEWNEALREVLR